jgi:hypothetical protein
MNKVVLTIIPALINIAWKSVKCFVILLLVAGFFSCNKQSNVEEQPEDVGWAILGKGEGQIEFLGKNYPLAGAQSHKICWFNLMVNFTDTIINGNRIIVMFHNSVYETWPSLELPEGTQEDFHAEFTLSDGTKGYGCANNETKMVVNKIDGEYDITITGKVLIIHKWYEDGGGESSAEPFRMAWKGEINISYGEPFCPR